MINANEALGRDREQVEAGKKVRFHRAVLLRCVLVVTMIGLGAIAGGTYGLLTGPSHTAHAFVAL